ncbi:MAG: alpha/beta hydrolase [Bacteroidales bacterium]|nr:alpha/beta hydrolase [Bacteroidales bacterium]
MKRLLSLLLVILMVAPFASGQAAKKKYVNRYGLSIYKQADGSFTANARTMSLLDGARPEGFFEPYKGVSFYSQFELEDVPYEEVVYKTYPDRKLVLYISKAVGATAPTPVVCYIHGGGWQRGNPKSYIPFIRQIAKYTGLAAVSIQYSLAGQEGATIAVSLQDLHDAVQFLRDHAAEYNLDTKRLAFVGHSAGGHLSCMMGMTEPDAKVVSNWSGPTEIETELEYWAGGKDPKMTHYFYDGDARKMRSCSPVYLVPKKRQVAVQQFQGTCDGLVHYTQALNFEKALKKAGQKTVETHIYQYYGHSLTSTNCDKSIELHEKFIQFVKEHIYD